MKTTTTSVPALATAANVRGFVEEAFDAVSESFEQFCLMAGIESLSQLMSEDVDALAGQHYEHCAGKPGYRWGHAKAHSIQRASLEKKLHNMAHYDSLTGLASRPILIVLASEDHFKNNFIIKCSLRVSINKETDIHPVTLL